MIGFSNTPLEQSEIAKVEGGLVLVDVMDNKKGIAKHSYKAILTGVANGKVFMRHISGSPVTRSLCKYGITYQLRPWINDEMRGAKASEPKQIWVITGEYDGIQDDCFAASTEKECIAMFEALSGCTWDDYLYGSYSYDDHEHEYFYRVFELEIGSGTSQIPKSKEAI